MQTRIAKRPAPRTTAAQNHRGQRDLSGHGGYEIGCDEIGDNPAPIPSAAAATYE